MLLKKLFENKRKSFTDCLLNAIGLCLMILGLVFLELLCEFAPHVPILLILIVLGVAITLWLLDRN